VLQRSPFSLVEKDLKTVVDMTLMKGVLTDPVRNTMKEVQMMKNCKSIIALLAMTALIVGLSGCKKEGPLERAGKKVDQAVEDIKK